MRRVLAALPLLLVACGFQETDSCFLAGTRVRTPRGDVPIQDIDVGDEVLAFREHDGAVTVRKVVGLLRGAVSRVRVLTLEDGTTIRTTDEHPFWDAERRAWIPAREVDRTTVLVHLADDAKTTKPTRVVATYDEVRSLTNVFNLTVDGEHTFFAAGIATHNKSPACDRCLAPSSITIANETGTELTVAVRSPSQTDLLLSRALLEGDLRISPPAHYFAAATALPLAPGQQTSIGNVLQVITTGTTGAQQTTRFASVVTVPGSKPVLAVGEGRIALHDRAGSLVVEADDPRAVTLVPLDDAVPACGRSPAAKAYDSSAMDSVDGEPLEITAVDRGPDDCLRITFGASTSASTSTLRACLPEGVFPFAVNDTVTLHRVHPDRDQGQDQGGEPSIRLERSGGPTLELASILFAGANVLTRDALTFAYEEGASCVHEESSCATIDVPAKVKVVNAAESTRVVVLGAAARIAGRTTCMPTFGVVGGAVAYVAIVTQAE